jgi:hypothetical protein
MWCKRYRSPVQMGDPPTCEAFTNSLPETILYKRFDHRKPHKGDGGIRFEQRDDIELKWNPD